MASGVQVVALVHVVPSTMAPLVGLDMVCAFPQAAALVEVVLAKELLHSIELIHYSNIELPNQLTAIVEVVLANE